VLVDARPEELTEWNRTDGVAVYGASPDQSPEAQTRIADLVLERGKRIAEAGGDVLILLDSATRLARARATAQSRPRRSRQSPDEPGSESNAPRVVKRWFSAARNTEEGGSLAILAAVRVGSDSPFEQLVYDLLSDSANMELRLDREIAAAGLAPPLDVKLSWSRRDAGAIDRAGETALVELRQSLAALAPAQAWRVVAERLGA
jgi:transcription termination factor Rho